MAFLNKQLTKDDITSSGSGGGYINKSGIYDVTLKRVSVSTAKSGAQAIDIGYEYNGNEGTIYGMYILNGQGDFLPGFKTFTQLATIAGLVDDDGKMVIDDPEAQTHKLGKDNKEVELQVLDQFTDFPCTIRVQMEYSLYNNEIRENKVIKSFFREDGAFAEEILAGKTPGGRLAFENEKLADNVTYKDDLTPEQVAAWKESKRSNKGAATAAAASTPKPAAKNGLFRN